MIPDARLASRALVSAHSPRSPRLKFVAAAAALAFQDVGVNTGRCGPNNVFARPVAVSELGKNQYHKFAVCSRRDVRCGFAEGGGLVNSRVCATEGAIPDEASSQATMSMSGTPGQSSNANEGLSAAPLEIAGPGDSREDVTRVKTTISMSKAVGQDESPSEELIKGGTLCKEKAELVQEYESTDEGTQGIGSEEKAEVVQEYVLTGNGRLSTVKVSVGGRTQSNLDRALVKLRLQAESFRKFLNEFSVGKFVRNWGKKPPGVEDLKFSAAMYDPKTGISSISQWTAMELALQRAQMVRIARDTLYLVWAFSLFGAVRILEAVATVFATDPPDFKKIIDVMNALDPLTVASLASALRKPVVGMLDVDPSNLEEVNRLKAKFWADLHNFYERQWKVMATLGMARLLTLIATQLPKAQWCTSKIKVVWDITMALPIF